jgi:hypothetical protein
MDLWIYETDRGNWRIALAATRAQAIRRLGAVDPSAKRLRRWNPTEPFQVSFDATSECIAQGAPPDYRYFWEARFSERTLVVLGNAEESYMAQRWQSTRRRSHEDRRDEGVRLCSTCGHPGHNKRTCTRRIRAERRAKESR